VPRITGILRVSCMLSKGKDGCGPQRRGVIGKKATLRLVFAKERQAENVQRKVATGETTDVVAWLSGPRKKEKAGTLAVKNEHDFQLYGSSMMPRISEF